jgi:hypothetical protein
LVAADGMSSELLWQWGVRACDEPSGRVCAVLVGLSACEGVSGGGWQVRVRSFLFFIFIN